jgi:hypothetical protein
VEKWDPEYARLLPSEAAELEMALEEVKNGDVITLEEVLKKC